MYRRFFDPQACSVNIDDFLNVLLALTLQVLLIRVGSWVGIPDAIPILMVIGISFYIAAYLFVAMRRVYGQGRIITFLKYVVLLFAYFTGFGLTMLGAVAIAAFSL